MTSAWTLPSRRAVLTMLAASAVTAQTHAQTPPTAPVVKVGVLTDMTSYVSEMAGQGSVVAAQMAITDYQKATGRTVELVSADNQAKPDVAMTIARRWFDEGVDLIVDNPPSSVALGVQALAHERGKISIALAAGAAALVGPQCTQTGFQWVYNTVAVARALATTVVKQGGMSWFEIVQDNAYGASVADESRNVVLANGGSVLGVVRTPTDMSDFSAALVQAASSGAQVIALGNTGSQAVSIVKQAREFGLDKTHKLVGLSLLLTEVKGIGLELGQGLLVADSFYWDQNDATRAWSARFSSLDGQRKPTSTQAGVYSAITHYLKARDAANSNDGVTIASMMRSMPVNDFMTDHARILPNGWVDRPFYLYQVKTPSESHSPWDLFNILATIPGDVVAPHGIGCPLE